jgi:hypothetical protein
MARLKIVCRKMYSRGIPKALHDFRDLWKLFVTASLILFSARGQGREPTVNEWLIRRWLCFFSTCDKHSRHDHHRNKAEAEDHVENDEFSDHADPAHELLREPMSWLETPATSDREEWINSNFTIN